MKPIEMPRMNAAALGGLKNPSFPPGESFMTRRYTLGVGQPNKAGFAFP
jgi:hypothetical protein